VPRPPAVSDVDTLRPHFLLAVPARGRGLQAAVSHLQRKHSGRVEAGAHHELQPKVLQERRRSIKKQRSVSAGFICSELFMQKSRNHVSSRHFSERRFGQHRAVKGFVYYFMLKTQIS
jgi:hypothetical protein